MYSLMLVEFFPSCVKVEVLSVLDLFVYGFINVSRSFSCNNCALNCTIKKENDMV